MKRKIPKIFIIGSTGKLGKKILNYSWKNNISIFGITCYSNNLLLKSQYSKFNIQHHFTLSDNENVSEMHDFFSNHNIDLIYFLDTGSESLSHLYAFNQSQKNSRIAIANKELLIAAGPLLNKSIEKNNNILIPLDSEHFSLLNSKISNSNISKIYITASGGPFYFKKDIDLNNVKMKSVLSHPKWTMGKNNLIDSSNFINKILEIFELSHIFNISLDKIDFLISQPAFIHSIVEYSDSSVQLNCFNNDMLIPLIKPLSFFYKLSSKEFISKSKLVNIENYMIEDKLDKRFKIFKHIKSIKYFSHSQQIAFLLKNKSAQQKYLSGSMKYNDIVPFVMNDITNSKFIKKLNTFNDVIKYIYFIKKSLI
jgi:1-deoxy-D-xylulose-5-phosphate reductoisomerase